MLDYFGTSEDILPDTCPLWQVRLTSYDKSWCQNAEALGYEGLTEMQLEKTVTTLRIAW